MYWLLPGKKLADGLRVIATDSDTNAMCSVVHCVKNLVVYFDHDDSIAWAPWDDNVANSVAQLPMIISPVKLQHIHKEEDEKLPDFYTNLRHRMNVQNEDSSPVVEEKENVSEDDSEGDSNFMDSDCEFMGGDDDLFVDHVDENVEDEGVAKGKKIAKGKKARGSRLKGLELVVTNDGGEDISTDEEGLQLPHEEGKVNLKFKSFMPEDINNPTFNVGMVFETVETLRKAITEYSLKNRVEIRMPRNDRKRIKAHCADGCPCNLYASWDSRVKTIMVKTYC